MYDYTNSICCLIAVILVFFLFLYLVINEIRMSGYQVYVLKLRDNCYYVGLSKNLKQRIRQHKNGTGSIWTRLHHPIKMIWHHRCRSIGEALRLENIMTRYYANLYGYTYVRGSGWTGLKNCPPTILDEEEKEFLQKFDVY